MLIKYITSTIIFLIIYKAMIPIGKATLKDKLKGLKTSYEGTGKPRYYVFCFIPVIRTIMLIGMWYLIVEDRDKIKEFLDLKEDDENKKECKTCKHRQTMNCPNSYYCYAREDKPYWEEK